ncbi:TD and POZ domain-containing protein 3 [Trichonephila clavata]|uniref:TD and POZ domain-containing protein 3 n=1 Tax=Trichonephila clavata TaxID=2740835 RepID=A0A8X6HSB7_TRICU|nr:TD and POZ domain-containing protein 3 [Trichonephila clavata]
MDSEREGYTFLWKIEHFNCAWHRKGEKIVSPVFVLDSLEKTKWRLWLFPKGDANENFISYYLKRHHESKGPDTIEIEYELSLLNEYCTPLQSTVVLRDSFTQGQAKGKRQFIKRDELFSPKDEFRDSVTACCRIGVRGKENLGSATLYARTIINVERCSFAWNIENFSKMVPCEIKTYEIQSALEDALVTLELFLTGHCCEESINVSIKSYNPNMKFFRFNSFLQDATGNRIDCGSLEFRVNDLLEDGKLVLLVSKKMLVEKKNIYLPNDVLSLNCECDFSTKIAFEGVERIDHGIFTSLFRKNAGAENRLDDPSGGITDALRSMYLDKLFCDTELSTPTKTFSAHKSILSARSPVFKAMFTNEMKEKIRERVDITDVDADTMHRILLYVYTDILEDLCLETASLLYEAADKYQILNLKSKCSSFLMDNLTVDNVCGVLVLADMHQDNDLKNALQDYILQNDKAIFCSSEWKHLLDTHTKLAAETMYLKYNKD